MIKFSKKKGAKEEIKLPCMNKLISDKAIKQPNISIWFWFLVTEDDGSGGGQSYKKHRRGKFYGNRVIYTIFLLGYW